MRLTANRRADFHQAFLLESVENRYIMGALFSRKSLEAQKKQKKSSPKRGVLPLLGSFFFLGG
jgi:hypothetical protein